jgi:hypothetical protein
MYTESPWHVPQVAGIFVGYTDDFASWLDMIAWLPWQLAHSAGRGSPLPLRCP